jgi:uncharacterized protein YcaQ
MIHLNDLRRYALARSLFPKTTLGEAINRLGFVQADPIRAPARAQDLILRHRVRNYRVADLDRHYPALPVEEDYFVNYGYLPEGHLAFMHPRSNTRPWDARSRKKAEALLAFIRERGEVHPRMVAANFAHGRVTNYWGGESNATTHLLDRMHYMGLLRVARRESGIRIYALRQNSVACDEGLTRDTQANSLVDLIVRIYAPLPGPTLSLLVKMLYFAAQHLRSELRAALVRARVALPHTKVGGVDWYWPADESPSEGRADLSPTVRFLAPFDPVVWDRRRFQEFWGWTYRFEAYMPAPKRRHGYYALPLLWRDEMIGWGNLTLVGGKLEVELGHKVGRRPRARNFQRELDTELDRIRCFLRTVGGRLPS